jgi:hypothetical protein
LLHGGEANFDWEQPQKVFVPNLDSMLLEPPDTPPAGGQKPSKSNRPQGSGSTGGAGGGNIIVENEKSK